MHKFLLLILAVLAGSARALAQHWQQQVNYSIDVTLTDSTHSLDGIVSIDYLNRSPDTLSFIWIRCPANAFKNDRTAFSEALIRKGRTDFYFSDKNRKGYINRLEFRADGQLARMEDHPQYIDVIRVILPHPLIPGDSVNLTTPFHVQLPDNFANDGYHQGIYAVTQWYPKPAVYDGSGWHPDPYVGQVNSYSEFGDFDVQIHAPAGLVIVAPVEPTPQMHFHQSNVSDFVWFASRRFHLAHDTLALPSGRIIDLYSYYIRSGTAIATYGITLLKNGLRYYSSVLGEYPFDQATLTETRAAAQQSSFPDDFAAAWPGMIGVDSRDSLYGYVETTIAKELALSWSAVITGVNGHQYPWMSEGISSYYYDRYWLSHRRPVKIRFPLDTFHRSLVNTRIVLRADQPMSTSWQELAPDNDLVIAGYKAAIWMVEREHSLGTALFDSSMREYFRHQAFRHTGPGDLKAALTLTSRRNFDSAFALLDRREPVPPSPYHRPLEPNFQLIPHPTHRNSLNISPAVGFNNYDHLMVGALIQTCNIPPDSWQLVAAPLYSAASHQWNGLFHFNYAWYPHQSFRLIEAGINGSRFSTISATDSNSRMIFGGFYKVAPYIRFFFPQAPQNTRTIALEGKVYLIGEKSFDNYVRKSTDSLYYPVTGNYDFRYVDQLTFSIRDVRVLYPYAVNLQVQQAPSWYRVNLDMRYFFNYASTGGLAVRLFGAKFGYLGTRNPAEDLTPFEPKLTGVRGTEDYTYGNYFIGRNDFTGVASQQIMMRDGDLKLRTDLFQSLQGRSDDWVGAVNLNSTLPVLPRWVPLRLFLDIGTYAQAWSDNPPTGHFLYAGGLELDLFHDVLRIYAPLVYSSDFSNQLKTVPGQSGFFHTISFSIDAHNIPFRQLFGYTPF